METLVTEGSKWHIISKKWIDKWQAYVYFDYISPSEEARIPEEQRIHPGKIDSSDIILTPP